MTEESDIFAPEFVAKFDSFKYIISELVNKGLYDDVHMKAINDDVDKIYQFIHSNYCNNIQYIVVCSFPQLAQNLQRHRFIDFLEPYEQIFSDNDIKLRSLPSSILSMDDSGTIHGFFQQLQTTLIYLKSRKNFLFGFNALHSLNFSISTVCGIITSLMKNQEIDDFYYELLNQINENLINLQNLLDLAKKIENVSNALLDMDILLIRKLPIIEKKLGSKLMETLNIK